MKIKPKDSSFISGGLVNMSDNIFLASINHVEFGFAQGKGMKHRVFHFTGYEVCREDLNSRIQNR